ncbi:permease-like cell division protein FtsX [Inmirania thermothiophila]|uniref:Cell division protein FtsX n=1 Tax=Inmirania thermothiophila TaxID=1750597 RepID=A0A3N1Y6T7_9GAMM|nr:permease-like cell division protein FtsX [Inmirania thermothiophila]ROR34241.1 cell division protein FtsX [Inmirania thermothiophila]
MNGSRRRPDPAPRRLAPPLRLAQRHAQAGIGALGRLVRTPLASLMTAAVIGIALALPALFYVLLDNARALLGGWESGAQISLFLRDEVGDEEAAALAEALRTRAEVASVRLIRREEALEEFRRHSGLGAALDLLPDNPLPAVVVVTPRPEAATPEGSGRLREALAALPEVEAAQLDLAWLRRLHALLALARRGVLLLGALLAAAVLLVVGNTIRLDIQNRRQEIEVMKLVGAGDAFVRRPFLYGGMWYGLAGGVIAWLLVQGALWLLRGPAGELAGLYGSERTLRLMDGTASLVLLAVAAALGLAGSWLAVGRHLRAIEPR